MMMKKCLNSGLDIKQGLLAIRNTPLGCGASPAELLMNRQLNDNLPRLPSQMVSDDSPKRDLMAERKVQKMLYDRKIIQNNPPTPFRPGQHVPLQDPVSKEWSIRGTIQEMVAPRSFNVKTTGGTILRRNRRQIRKLHSTTSSTPQHHIQHSESDTDTNNNPDSDSDTDTLPYDDIDEQLLLHEQAQQQQLVTTTRSGREVHHHQPTDYEDL